MGKHNALSLLLNIPLILDEITASFSKHELFQCTQVCSSWNNSFAPLLWKNLQFNNHQVVSLFQTSPAIHRGLERNAESVRFIHSVFCYPFHTFVTMKPFHNLTKVDSLASELHNKGIVDHTNTQTLVRFIGVNTSIREIILTNFPLANIPTSEMLGNVIANHPGLKSVTINCFRDTELASVQHVLRGVGMSKSVSKLSIVCRSSVPLVQEPTLTQADDSNFKEAPYQLLPRDHVVKELKELRLDLIIYRLSATLSSLVRHCPNLQRLYIPSTWIDDSFEELCSTLHQYCPKLEHVEGGLSNPQDHHLAMLLDSSQNLKSYSMKNDQTMGSLSIQALLNDRHCFTLERLNFKQCIAIKSNHIQLILTSCPNLKSFEVLSSHDRQDISDPRLDIRDLPIHSTKGPEWVCRGLQELRIGFTGFSEIAEDESVQPYVSYIYEQLAALTNLRELHLGGELGMAVFPKSSRVWAFDFTLRSGIHKLETLKELECLNVQRLKHHQIGKPEVEWMVRHWPRLIKFHGPFVPSIHRKGGVASIESKSSKGMPGFLQELIRHRPTLSISVGVQFFGAS